MKSKAAQWAGIYWGERRIAGRFAGIPAYEEYKMLVKNFRQYIRLARREQNEEDKDHMFCE